ncbi:tryptophan 2,3-dioxygenase family protein [Lentzea sp. NPDC004782]|uniref:tryptophan 2,3-dioxygenase family protein n=1 Tax=Lentzea sp. NPDC004782 TaxID=3154458 RepID=UPI0033A48969
MNANRSYVKTSVFAKEDGTSPVSCQTMDPFPVAALIDHAQQVGKEALDPRVIKMARIARQEHADDPFLVSLLNNVLDKQDQRFTYDSYLALELLAPLMPAQVGDLEAHRLVRLLLTDLVEFETSTADTPGDQRLARNRPVRAVTDQRIAKATRLVAELRGRSSLLLTTEDERRRLRVSVLPVSSQHDEYLFIRVLQCYETVFSGMAMLLEEAMAAARADATATVAQRLTDAAASLNCVAGLFSLLATMRPESFHAFRDQTTGSSAVQSRHYKLIELLCGVPKPDRLDSLAFRAVPEVRARATFENESLTSWYLTAAPTMAGDERLLVDDALRALEHAHQKWKRTHYSLGRRMIGVADGTGGTEGVGYLLECLDNRLFWGIGEHCRGMDVHRTLSRP